MQTITLGGGCFWCTESAFRALVGVTDVTSGYAGGTENTANYEAVCSGLTEHVEVIKVSYNEAVIDTKTLLHIFFSIHDPTTLNRQGNDIGKQYASVIYYHTAEQQKIAEQLIQNLEQQSDNKLNIVTRVEPITSYFDAEDYHQDYFTKNPNQGYCNAVIPPKLLKIQTYFPQYFKS